MSKNSLNNLNNSKSNDTTSTLSDYGITKDRHYPKGAREGEGFALHKVTESNPMPVSKRVSADSRPLRFNTRPQAHDNIKQVETLRTKKRPR